jgi:hypothetical protein
VALHAGTSVTEEQLVQAYRRQHDADPQLEMLSIG